MPALCAMERKEAKLLPRAKEHRPRLGQGGNEQPSPPCCPGGVCLKLRGSALYTYLGRSGP